MLLACLWRALHDVQGCNENDIGIHTPIMEKQLQRTMDNYMDDGVMFEVYAGMLYSGFL